MTEIRHHPKTETLADFAAGRLDEARAVVIATHLAECAECAEAVAGFEAAAGAMLDKTEPVAMADDALEKIFARADQSANVILQGATDAAARPRPLLSQYLDGSIDDVQWKRVAPGLSQSVIEADGYRPGVLRLLKIAPGTKIPKHTHSAEELTLILRGAYVDEIGEFQTGDLADLDDHQTHSPKAVGDAPCICLIATAGPLKFKSLLGQIAQPFIRL